jgi:hypothetical protein
MAAVSITLMDVVIVLLIVLIVIVILGLVRRH